MNPNTLQEGLAQFYGTEAYHRWSILWPNFILTDGAKFLADSAGAYWLMDIIASHQRRMTVRHESFQVWKLTVKDSQGKIVAEDGNGKVIAEQSIPYTDFPLDEIKLYAIYDTQYMVILLPSEY